MDEILKFDCFREVLSYRVFHYFLSLRMKVLFIISPVHFHFEIL